jgi:hypothetical protein
MYSFDKGSGVGGGGDTNGFQLVGALFASGCPNHPVFFPVNGSVDGSQPFFAKAPSVTSTTSASVPVHAKSFVRFCAVGKFVRDMGSSPF